MMSVKHLLLLILMVYVSVLNVMLVNTLFGKYLSRYTEKRGQTYNNGFGAVFRHQTPLTPFTESPKLQKLKHLQTRSDLHDHHKQTKPGVVAGCPEEDSTYIIGLVPRPPDLSVHNDMASHRNVRIMSELRHVLRHDRQAKARIYVFLDADTFLAAHRTWCQILPEQTSQRASCELVLLQSKATNSLLFSHVLEKEKCLQDFILLHDTAHIGPSFLARIQGASRHKATCLAASFDAQTCPVTAFRLPRAFLVAWARNKYDASMTIEAAAMEFHLWGGGVTAVGVGGS